MNLLQPLEKKVYSQNGEDGILEALVAHIGARHQYMVEISAGDGVECNSRLWREKGWRVLATGNGPGLIDTWVTAENVRELLEAHDVARDFDVLSLDIDGMDYWVLEELLRTYKPCILCVEYNAMMGIARVAVPYDPKFRWDQRSQHYGASLPVLAELCDDYTLLGCESSGVNAFFVRTDVWRRTALVPFGREPFEPSGLPLVEWA